MTFKEYLEMKEAFNWKPLAGIAIAGAMIHPSHGIQKPAQIEKDVVVASDPIKIEKGVDKVSNPVKKEDKLAFQNKVSAEFKRAVIEGCRKQGIDPNNLMAAMAFETGETFNPSIRSRSGSGAVGLIQFMERTAEELGTTTAALSKMKDTEQLKYVFKYFERYSGRIHSLEDLYMAILYPKAIGKDPSYVLFVKGTKAYEQNVGLDADRNGKVTVKEAAAKVRSALAKGMTDEKPKRN